MSKQNAYNRNTQHRRFMKVAKLLFESGYYQESVELTGRLATNAMNNYPGFYTDGALENLLAALGSKCKTEKKSNLVPIHPTKKRSIHIVSSVATVGGHTRLLKEWIKRDREHQHLVIIVNESLIPSDYLGNCDLIFLEKEADPLKKASILRGYLLDADFIFLHHSPNDIISIIALASTDIKAPVAVMNHADHMYWTGAAVCDYLIEIREGFLTLDKERRQIDRGGYLPVPVEPLDSFDRTYCRNVLEIQGDQVLLLTIASAYKFDPVKPYHFFNDLIEVLNTNPQSILLVVGVTKDHHFAIEHPQIQYLGIRTDTELLKAACDIYIESFPFASFTSLLETAVNHKAYQLMYHPPLMSRMVSGNEDDRIIWNYPASKKEWITQLNNLIVNKTFREQEAEKKAALIKTKHKDNWPGYLKVIYEQMTGVKHQIKKLIPAGFRYDIDDAYLDILLKNCYQMDIQYQMVAVPLLARVQVCIKWLLDISSIKKGDFIFLLHFLKGSKKA